MGKPKISMIVAMDMNNGIGKDGDMPWHLSADLKFFKKTTMGFPIVMGRKTFESLPFGPLKGRRNIVISRDKDLKIEGAEVIQKPEDVFDLFKEDEEIFVIGGGSIYKLFMPYADQLFITIIDHSYEADTFFPDVDSETWANADTEKICSDPAFAHSYSFNRFTRK